jgi:hypothetical protein
MMLDYQREMILRGYACSSRISFAFMRLKLSMIAAVESSAPGQATSAACFMRFRSWVLRRMVICRSRFVCRSFIPPTMTVGS